MSKVTNIIDSLSHNASLVKELAEKSIIEKTKIMLREIRGQVAKEILSKNASDAVMASVTPQIKIAKNLENLSPDVLKIVKKCQAEIQRLGLLVDEEAQTITRRMIELSGKFDDVSMKERDELYKEMEKIGYDYLEGDTPIKLSAQPNEALLNIINKYRPNSGTNSVYEKALQILKERGVM